MCCIYFVWMCISWFWPKIAVFVGRGLLGTGESISDECGVIGSAEHLRSTIHGPLFDVLRLLYVNVYFMILTKIDVFVGRGLLGTGESISDECGVIGSAEPLRSTIWWSQFNVFRLLCVNVCFVILATNCCFRRERFSRNRRVDIRRVPWGENGVIGTAEHHRSTI